MTYSIIQKLQLEGTKRLDAEYYQPEYLENNKKVTEYGFFMMGNIASVVYGTTPKSAEFYDIGIPFIRSQNFVISLIDQENLVFCSEKFHRLNNKSKIIPKDILFAAVGATIGKLAIVQDSIKQGNINQNLARVRIKDKKVSPFFIWIFYNSIIGQLQIKRLVTGNAQPYLNSEQIKLLKVPKLKTEEQFYFKDVYNKINGLTAEAIKICVDAKGLLLDELKINELNLNDQLSYITNLSEAEKYKRQDAEYFQPKYDNLIHHIKQKCNGVKLGDLVTIKKGIEPGAEDYQEEGKPFIRVSNMSKNGINDNNQKYLCEDLYIKLKKDYEPKKGEILLTKDASLGIAYLIKQDVEGIISGGILRLKLKNNSIDSEYLTLCLNSIVGQMQAERDAGGSIINHWKPEQIKNVVIPILPREVQNKISDLVLQSFVARWKAEYLLEEAKRKVEEAIENIN